MGCDPYSSVDDLEKVTNSLQRVCNIIITFQNTFLRPNRPQQQWHSDSTTAVGCLRISPSGRALQKASIRDAGLKKPNGYIQVTRKNCSESKKQDSEKRLNFPCLERN